jgi:YD repeat-containing protein
VIQIEHQTDGILTNRSTTNYKIWSTAPSIVAPENVIIQTGANPVETRFLFTNYDSKGNVLEQQKINDAKHTYLYDYNSTFPVAEIINADFNNVAYTSFEADGNGNWSISSTTRDMSDSRTGLKSYNLGSGTIAKSGLTSGTTYRLSFWAKGSVLFNGTAMSATSISVNNWNYFEKTFTSLAAITISGTGLIDEMRLCPDAAQMSTYTYDPLIGITSVNDVSNRSTYYMYDGLNRLQFIKDRKGNIVKSYEYNYQLR